MLDDLKLIHEKDPQDALGIAAKQADQLEINFDLERIEGNFANVVVSGMGGSALGALFYRRWPSCILPFEVSRNYTLPNYVSENTLFIASSYSGNTEETLSALAEAEKRGAKIVIVSNDGKLAEIAAEKNYPIAKLPKVGQPRFGALAGFKALVDILNAAGLTHQTELLLTTAKAASHVRDSVKDWLPDVPTSKNPAKQLAQELMGSSTVLYASKKFSAVAYKWKISINENAKNVAWYGTYPEFSHNEFIGWTERPVDKPYKVVDLRSKSDHPRIQKRFELTDQMLSGRRPAAHVVELQGDNELEHMLWGAAFGDFVSLYMAILNGLNPTPVDAVEEFKKRLSET